MRYQIKELREKKGITRWELAKKAEIPELIVKGLEEGKIKLATPQTLLNLASALDTTVDNFFCPDSLL